MTAAFHAALCISFGPVSCCLNALVGLDCVKVRNVGASDYNVRCAYILTPKGAVVP